MSEHTEISPEAEDDGIGIILAQSNTRPVPRTEVRERAFLRLKREWELAVRRRRWLRRLYALGAAASLAAIVAVTAQIGEAPVTNNVSIASEILKISGDDFGFNGQDVGGARLPSHFSAGDTITTGSESRIALSWQSSGSLRLNARSQLVFLSPHSIRLNYGAMYFDSNLLDVTGMAAATISIETPHGIVSHLGTQFMTEVSPAHTAVSVREGTVHFESQQHSFSIPSGDSVEILADNSTSLQSIAPSGGRWDWVTAIAPEMEFNGRSTLDLLNWIARETGRELRFESGSARDLAASDTLVGLERVGPIQALAYIPLISDLDCEVDGDVINVSTKAPDQ